MEGIREIRETWYNPGQNIWNNVRKSREIGQEQRTLISTFAYFLIAFADQLLVEQRLSPIYPPKLEILLTFDNFLRSQVSSRLPTRDATYI